MIKIPEITLICLTNKNIPEHEYAIEKSCEGIEFGAVKMIVDYKCTSIDEWNRKIIQDLYKYVDTSHALLIHGDGYVINPHLWNPDWLTLDFIGSPFPSPSDDYSYRTPSGRLIRVGNSVSLRSKKLMDLVATRNMEYHYGNNNEDGEICVWQRDWLEEQGCKFGTFEQALDFGRENDLPEHKGRDTFLFHSL